jgi:HEPN domain-containing protein
MRRSRDWLDQAVRDVEHARASIELGHFEWSCFAAQQAAEEAERLVTHAQRIVEFCTGLPSPAE